MSTLRHRYLMEKEAGVAPARGRALTENCAKYGFARRWWAGEKLWLVGDRLFDRRVVRTLSLRVFGRTTVPTRRGE